MILTAITSLVIQTSQPSTVKAPIVAASMFKNGYAVVLREFSVKGEGAYELDSIPNASLGTLWFSTSGGPKIGAVKAVDVQQEGIHPLESIDAILRGNIGKKVRLGMKNGDEVTGPVQTGTLNSAQGDIVVLETEKELLVIQKTSITSVAGVGGQLKFDTPSVSTHRALVFTVQGGPGKVQILSLERGLSWAPSYAVDISDKKFLKLTAKSTVVNNLEDLDQVSSKFITGFPNIPYAATLDPLIETAQIVRMAAQNMGVMTSNSQQFGGQGLVPEGANAVTFDPSDNSVVVDGLPGQQIEDLFFYNEPNLSLKQGERASITLFTMEAPYRDVYSWDISNSTQNDVDYRPLPEGPGDVWHGIEFQNTSGQPFTTGVATTLKTGELIGQDTMYYVSPKAKAELKITKALDIRAEAVEQEVSRQRAAIANANGIPLYDLVTLKGTLALSNSKKEAVELKVRKDFTGEFVNGDQNPNVNKTAKGLLQTNSTGRILWDLKLAAGEKLHVSYTYKLYVRSGR